MTTVFQQAIQLIALALGFGFLKEFAAIAPFEPVQDLIWKLLMSLGFIYMATRVPSMLGNAGTFDAWLSTLYFGMNLPGAMVRSARSIGLIAGGAAGGPGGMAVGTMAASAGLSAAASGLSSAASMATPSAGGETAAKPPEQRRVATTTHGRGRVPRRPIPRRRRGDVQVTELTTPTGRDERNARSERGDQRMEDLTQTISNLVGILLGIVGGVGVGFFIYGAYLYLTASGAPTRWSGARAQ